MSDKKTKTNHQTGYHKRVVNPTTNYAIDSHKAFCGRCYATNEGICPVTKRPGKSPTCNV